MNTHTTYYMHYMLDKVRRLNDLQQAHLSCVFVSLVKIAIMHSSVCSPCTLTVYVQHWISWSPYIFVEHVDIRTIQNERLSARA